MRVALQLLLLFGSIGIGWFGVVRLTRNRIRVAFFRHVLGALTGFVLAGIVMSVTTPSQPVVPLALGEAPPFTADLFQQQRFEAARAEYFRLYDAAPDAAAKTQVYKRVKDGMDVIARKGLRVFNYRGTIESLTIEPGGVHAFIDIKSTLGGRPVNYATRPNLASDMGTGSAITRVTRKAYNRLVFLKVGDEVVFTGELIADPTHGVLEASSSEQSAMAEPRFLVRFQEIQKK